MKRAYDFYKSIILINKNITKESFLNAVGAQSGYSSIMFGRMYDSITSQLINIEREFELYYKFEYRQFDYFLFKKYNLSEESIEEILKTKKKYSDCIIYKMEDYSYGDYGLGTFTFSEEMYDRISKILLNNKR